MSVQDRRRHFVIETIVDDQRGKTDSQSRWVIDLQHWMLINEKNKRINKHTKKKTQKRGQTVFVVYFNR